MILSKRREIACESQTALGGQAEAENKPQLLG